MKTDQSPSVALVYLARGVELDHLDRIDRFVESYRVHNPGIHHKLYVITKGYLSRSAELLAQGKFAGLQVGWIPVSDGSFDLGAYAEASKLIDEDFVCYLNMNSEIVSEDWLLKLFLNLDQPYVGGVAATGSFESLSELSLSFPVFPNPHLRSNAIMFRRLDGIRYFSSATILVKLDAYLLESGPMSITRQMMARGLVPLLVGRDGRGYGVDRWQQSRCFRQGMQDNLLVHDNMTRLFEKATFAQKLEQARGSWGAMRNSPSFG